MGGINNEMTRLEEESKINEIAKMASQNAEQERIKQEAKTLTAGLNSNPFDFLGGLSPDITNKPV